MKSSNDLPSQVSPGSSDPNEPWASALGAILVLSILLCLGLVAAGGWPWFQKFIERSAPALAQAIGSIGAIIAAIYISRAQITSDRELERARLAEDVRKKILVIDALLEALKASVAMAQKQFNDYPNMPVSLYFIDRVRTTSQALAKIDLFACPASIIKPLLHLFPTPCENLLESLHKFEESFDKLDGHHERHFPQIHNSFTVATLMVDQAREACKAALTLPSAAQ